MGMAAYDAYPVPRIRKVYGLWRVTFAGLDNRVYYREFTGDRLGWTQAVKWATR